MKIYTKGGDKGETSLWGGKRVSKTNIRLEAYGTVDELNAHIATLKEQPVNQTRIMVLEEIQKDLFAIGSLLASTTDGNDARLPIINEHHVTKLEKAIDAMQTTLPPLKSFILPGGHPSVSLGHIARTVSRRAERAVCHIENIEQQRPFVIPYLNRLSDYLFVLCRIMAQALNIIEKPWLPEKDN